MYKHVKFGNNEILQIDLCFPVTVMLMLPLSSTELEEIIVNTCLAFFLNDHLLVFNLNNCY